MFRIDKTSANYDNFQQSQRVSQAAQKNVEISFKTSEAASVKEGYALMGLEINGDPPTQLMKHMNDTLKRHIVEDSTFQIYTIARGNKGAPWCAYTVSYFLRSNGVKIPVMPAVSQFIDWGKKNGRYNKLPAYDLTEKNYRTQVKIREGAIKKQISSMQEGDLIIWKSHSLHTNGYNGIKTSPVSHIGIVKSIDKRTGKITVVEGNANESEKTSRVGIRGVRTGNELLKKDQLMEKTYDAQDLAVGGYSGYISMTGLVK